MWHLLHTWDHHFLLLFPLGSFFLFGFLLVSIEIVLLTSKASSRDHKISKSTFEVFPVINVVEHGHRDGLNLRSDQIWEELEKRLNEVLHGEGLVGVHLMWLSVGLDWLKNQVVFYELDQLLDDLALEFEASEMSAIGHDFDSLLQNRCEE